MRCCLFPHLSSSANVIFPGNSYRDLAENFLELQAEVERARGKYDARSADKICKEHDLPPLASLLIEVISQSNEGFNKRRFPFSHIQYKVIATELANMKRLGRPRVYCSKEQVWRGLRYDPEIFDLVLWMRTAQSASGPRPSSALARCSGASSA